MRLVSDLLAQARLLTLLAEQTDHPPTHPFTVYHVARAAWLASVVLSAPDIGDSDTANALLAEVTALQDLAKSLTERLLAQSVLRGTREMDAVPLAYCAATLALPVNGDERYVEEALRHCTASQEERGAWTDGRMLVRHRDPDTGKPILLSSHEVALTIAECVSWTGIPRRVKQRFPAEASGSLVAALSYARRSVVQVEDANGNRIEGWRSSAAFGETSVEAVPTAAILRLAVTARRVASLERGARALEHFDNVWDPSRGDHVPPYLEWEQYRRDNEPDRDNKILPDLNDWFVRKALEHRKSDIRPWAHPPAMSALLFGPPGTTKTTIVKAMAQGMGWPLVTLSPGTFIRDGLEHVERRAIEVFALLRDLSGVVVLFDECDELFRTRERAGDSENNDQTRSISAFMTASMLPKLQDLRDHGHVFFVIATNYFGQIDSAVKRLGRIDRMVGVGWPDKAQRRHIIRTELRDGEALTALSEEQRRRAMDELADQSRWHIRGDIVHFAQALEARQAEFAKIEDSDKFDEQIGQITANVPEIARVHIDAFLVDAVSSSASHVKGRGELR